MRKLLWLGALCAGIMTAAVACDDDDGHNHPADAATDSHPADAATVDAAADGPGPSPRSALERPGLPRPPQGRLPADLLPPGFQASP